MEIKFRAWNKNFEEYNEVISINFPTRDVVLFSYGIADFSEVVLEQYTGVIDCNGKEIYVGDIVKYIHEWEISPACEEVDEVKYINGGFSPMQLVNGGIYYGLSSEPVYEIIGNIHENKNLLNNV